MWRVAPGARVGSGVAGNAWRQGCWAAAGVWAQTRCFCAGAQTSTAHRLRETAQGVRPPGAPACSGVWWHLPGIRACPDALYAVGQIRRLSSGRPGPATGAAAPAHSARSSVGDTRAGGEHAGNRTKTAVTRSGHGQWDSAWSTRGVLAWLAIALPCPGTRNTLVVIRGQGASSVRWGAGRWRAREREI